STTQELTTASVYATTPDMFSAAELKIFDHLTSHARFRNFGADCYAYALLASGYVDLVMEAGLGQFDFLALAPVVEGAGGSISDWQGEPLSFDSQGQVLASANQELHNKALDLIAAQAAGT
ncbi:MAG TPA: inositol monophosphatase family protein, partial [Arenicellales bacterium]|nr:inositol monophosphatase family protein [Arenicellales bacterium]